MIENIKGKTVNTAIVEHMAMENEELRGLLRLATDRWESWASEIIHTTPEYESELSEIARVRAALSQQAEPIEPAPAQDERNPTPDDYLAARSALESCDWSNVPLGTKAILGRVVDLLWLAAQARPAQTEQQLVADLYEIGGKLLEIAHTKTKAVSTTLMAPHRDYTLKDARATALVMGERLVGMADRLGRAAPIAQTAPQPEQSGPPDVCDGKEQEAFEEFARGERMDMTTHPLHWLFLNEKTNAARQGWKAAIRYCRAALSAQGESHE